MMNDHMPLSPLNVGSSELDKDILAALDEMLSFTPDSTVSTSIAQPPIDPVFQLSDVFEMPEMPNPFDQPMTPTEEPKLGPQPTKTTDTTSLTTTRSKDARTTPYQQAKPKPKRRRKRPKDELDYLRAKVTDLEEELTNLSGSAGRVSPNSDEDEELFSRWKQVADRQKEEADRTVVENLKLRAMLQGQLQIARRLEAAIAGHQQEAASFVPWNFVQPEVNVEARGIHRPRAVSISDEQIFAELNGCLESQYASVDAVLAESDISTVNQDLPRGIELLQDSNGISFGSKEVRLLPFSLFAVNRVMWSVLLCDNITPKLGRIQTHILNNDHLNATIIDTLQLPKSNHTEVKMRMAVRRYFETDRVVVVWSASLEIAGSVFVRLRETGISTVSNFDFIRDGNAASKTSPTGSIMRSVVDVKPEAVDFNSNAGSGARIGDMTDLVIGTYHHTFGMLFQIFENLLLNDLVGSNAPNPDTTHPQNSS